MKAHQIQRIVAVAAAGVIVTLGATRFAHADSTAVSWIGATAGQWTDAMRWTGGVAPADGNGTTYSATVDASGTTPYTVTLANTTLTSLDALAVNAANATVLFSMDNLIGTAITVNAGRVQLTDGSLNHVRLDATWTGAFAIYGGTWNNVTLGAGFALDDASTSQVAVSNGLHLDGTTLTVQEGPDFHLLGTSLDGNGTIVVLRRPDSANYSTTIDGTDGFSIGSGVTIRAASGAASVGAPRNGSDPLAAWTNYGTLLCNSTGSLDVRGAWTNEGTIGVSYGTLTLGGSYATATLGTILHTGGAVYASGTLDNTDNTFRLDDVRGSWNANGLTINGGRVETSGPNQLDVVGELSVMSGLSLADVTLAGIVNVAGNATMSLKGTHLTLDDAGVTGQSVINITGPTGSGSFTLANLQATQAMQIDGSGEIRLITVGTGVIRDVGAGGAMLRLGPNIRLRAMNGGSGKLQQVIVDGSATAEGPNASLTLADDTTINHTLAASNGGQLVLGVPRLAAADVPVNNGQITVDAASSALAYAMTAATDSRLDIAGTLLAGPQSVFAGPLSATDATVPNVTLRDSAVVELDVGLHSSQLVNDTLTFTGPTVLDGELRIRALKGYMPLPGVRLHVLNFQSTTSGAFTSVTNTLGYAGLRLAIQQADQGADVLFTATPGDANLDGAVNFTDLLSLARHYNGTGQTWLTGDFTSDGTVNFDDLLALAKSYQTPAGSAASADVFASDWAMAQALAPEPTALLATLGLAAPLVRRRRR